MFISHPWHRTQGSSLETEHAAAGLHLVIAVALRCLPLDVGLPQEVVATRKEGKNVYYSVADPALLEVLALVYKLYCPKE